MRRRALVIVGVLAALAFGAWYGLRCLPADFEHGVEADCTSIPQDDEVLAEWIRRQPGVGVANVRRKWTGVGDRRWRVEVIFVMTRNGWGEPPLPDLDAAAAALGYRGPDVRFRDLPRGRCVDLRCSSPPRSGQGE